MLEFTSEVIEYRGYRQVTSKKGNSYYLLHCENLKTSEPYQFYVSNYDMIKSFEKGDEIKVVAFYDFKFKNLKLSEIALA